MKKNKETIQVITDEYDKEMSLMSDLKAWIEDDEFEPPFPYNVLWSNNRVRNLRILATAAQRAYDDAMREELQG